MIVSKRIILNQKQVYLLIKILEIILNYIAHNLIYPQFP